MHSLRKWVLANWILMLAAALSVRLLLAPFFFGFGYDMMTFGQWGRTMLDHPLSQFYAIAPAPDHLPGDLYLHGFLAWVFETFVGENLEGGAYRFLLKAVPSLADIGVAILIWLIIRRVANEERARLAALFYAWNPATIFLSAVWGQWDVVSGLIMLLGLSLVWLRPSRWLFAIPILAWCVLIKPPMAMLCVIGLVMLPLTDLRRGLSLMEVVRARFLGGVAAAVLGLGTILLLILPFDVGFPGMGRRWSIIERLNVAIDLYPNTTLGAANIWMIPLRSPDRVSDQEVLFLGLSAQTVGNLLFGVALLYTAAVFIRKWNSMLPLTLTVWGMVMANYAYFLLPTRSHERYLFPAVMMIVVLWGCARPRPQLTWLATAVSAAYFFNILGVYLPIGGTGQDLWFLTNAAANLILFLMTASYPFWGDSDADEAEVAGTPLPVYADDYQPDFVLAQKDANSVSSPS